MRHGSADGGAAAPDAAAARPPPPPSPPAPSASMPLDALKRKIKLLVDEHGSNGDDAEARESTADVLKAGASPAQLYAQLLATMTAKHKDEAEYAERFGALLGVCACACHACMHFMHSCAAVERARAGTGQTFEPQQSWKRVESAATCISPGKLWPSVA